MVPIVPVQCWLAREALGWSASHLARVAGVSPPTVRRFERGDAVRASKVEAIQRTLETAGVIFIDAEDGGPSARLRLQCPDARVDPSRRFAMRKPVR
jgi:transcriptional regulator with XRE-family HTH domain